MSTENKSLKFIHLASDVAAKDRSFEAGAIIFEPKSGRIAVKGENALEYYGGGRIADAKFENSILTLSFNDESKAITLDFSDTASASGVDKILGKLRYDVDALNVTINGAAGGDGSDGLVKKVEANETAIQANTDAIAAINHKTTGILAQAKSYADDLSVNYDAAGAAATAETNAKAYADGKVGDIAEGTTVKEYVDAGDAKALTDAKSYTNTEIGKVNSAAEALGGRVDTLVTKVTTLVGDDADKSVRTISAEEVAKVVAGADEKYDTLKEIADWIANDTTGAAKMANDISNLKTSVGEPAKGEVAATGLYKDIADNKSAINVNAGAIKVLQDLHAPGKNVAAEVADGINKIAEASASAGTDVVVTVKTKSGSVSAVTVDAGVLAGKVTANTNAITAEVTRAKGKEDELRNDLGTKLETEGDAFTRIKALETAQSSGSLTWFDWQN